ncbi:tRNA (guanosine(46)-N7)-methyltransferase TrmB [Geobacter chapellei]|uniref:tRNA (guanine-N(7)-)-methyltransferase n=1 Tax=Pelotalea chapellei TaxID=44671 RepID=A0ABS5UBY4_9BACT|nr:tRNA (guanosine(46)-N7)-methyltransferase TrmB [Pelotalea chapellei]
MPDWQQIFGNDRPLALEIGSGMGDFVARMAQLRPELNFIAIDYYNKGCLKTCKRIDTQELENVRVVRDEARSFLVRCIPPASLSAIFINCPDPWPKLRHRKRRLVNREFILFLSQFMLPGADIHFATDFEDYGQDVARLMPEVTGFENVLQPDLYRHELEGYPLSKYMLKFLAEGKKIHFIHYRKCVRFHGHTARASESLENALHLTSSSAMNESAQYNSK